CRPPVRESVFGSPCWDDGTCGTKLQPLFKNNGGSTHNQFPRNPNPILVGFFCTSCIIVGKISYIFTPRASVTKQHAICIVICIRSIPHDSLHVPIRCKNIQRVQISNRPGCRPWIFDSSPGEKKNPSCDIRDAR